MKFETLAIHAGQEPDPNNGAVMTPVYLTSTYMQDGVAKPRQGYEYSRTQNPTRKALQDCLAALEGGAYGLAFASGLAATDTVLRLLNADDQVSRWSFRCRGRRCDRKRQGAGGQARLSAKRGRRSTWTHGLLPRIARR